MASLNKVILIGNLGKDPEIRYTQQGEPIANFSLATSEKWTGKDGTNQEKTEWHKIVVFGKQAKVVQEYVSKGKPLYVEGALSYGEYVNKDGNKVHTTEIHVKGFNSRIVLLGSRGESAPRSPAAPGESGPADDFQASDEDVPF